MLYFQHKLHVITSLGVGWDAGQMFTAIIIFRYLVFQIPEFYRTMLHEWKDLLYNDMYYQLKEMPTVTR